MSSSLNRLRTLAVGVLALFGARVHAEPSPVFVNSGVTNTPVIDAVTFINRGTFNITAPDIPYDTQNTRYFTNFPGAIIQGSGGVRFGFVGEDGFRHPADSFYNAGTIRMDADSFGFSFGGFIVGFYPNSWVLIDATNVINRGGISVGGQGLMKIEGDNVQISRSGLRAGEDPTAPISEGFEFPPNYTTDEGVEDLYAGVGVNNALDPATPGPVSLQVLSGSHEVLLPSGFTNRVSVSAPHAFAVTNALGPTNWLVQVVFVDTNSLDPQFATDVRFAPPRNPSVDGALMAMVQFTFRDVDTITGEPFTNYVYVLDNLGAVTNATFYTNIISTNLLRPSTMLVTRVTPPEWEGGTGTNVVYSPDLIVSPNYPTDAVTNIYAAYSAYIGPSTRSPLFGNNNVVGGAAQRVYHPTNEPGRIEIEADSLDINLTRIRSEGLLSIKTPNLAPKPPYLVDSPSVIYDVGNTTGPLVVSNLVETTIRRFTGEVRCWSGAWTNETYTTAPDPADPALTVTNTIEIRFHALIVEHDFQTIVPVTTLSFAGKAEDIVVHDDVTVTEGFRFDTPRLDVRGSVFSGPTAWNIGTLPRLASLTNSGSIGTTDEIRLGGTGSPIQSIVNSGDLAGNFVYFNAASLENSGDIRSTAGDIDVAVEAVKLEGGSLAASANLRITASDLKMQGTEVRTGSGSFGALVLDVRDRLTDGDSTNRSRLLVTDGLQLVRKPVEGDLRQTSVRSFLNRFREGVHVWAGEDRGATVAGFTNNVALGQLTLDGTMFTLFTFVGPDASNPYGLYVDYLELTNAATDVELSLNLATNLTIYFADSNVPADELDGALGGRLRWVPERAAEFSGVPLTLASGRTLRVSPILLGSTTLDSDGDGIVNASDSTPFEPDSLRVGVRLIAGSPAQTEISWGATPGGRYRVEYSSSLQGGWQPLATCENKEGLPGRMSTCDALATGGEQRFYRVVEIR